MSRKGKNMGGDIIRMILADHNMSQARLAEMVGRTQQSVSEMLKRDISLSLFYGIIDALGYEIIIRRVTRGGRTRKIIRVSPDLTGTDEIDETEEKGEEADEV